MRINEVLQAKGSQRGHGVAGSHRPRAGDAGADNSIGAVIVSTPARRSPGSCPSATSCAVFRQGSEVLDKPVRRS